MKRSERREKKEREKLEGYFSVAFTVIVAGSLVILGISQGWIKTGQAAKDAYAKRKAQEYNPLGFIPKKDIENLYKTKHGNDKETDDDG